MPKINIDDVFWFVARSGHHCRYQTRVTWVETASRLFGGCRNIGRLGRGFLLNDLGMYDDQSLVGQRKDAWVGVCDFESARGGVRTDRNVDWRGAVRSENVGVFDVGTGGTWTGGV